ncbi:hypothetical protein Emtol_0170 (plasmid) [Emticicia oligotrophica DSM 17448]|uniref:Uncharacterized protein n=1 Tax=Emticicia oligotrophica (strain DSM 17448 / CIP 109782 / MTCC 6937 / GPTSA100-15) TaxID=929562 RepID=A0ABM5N7K4_EMTOG|nr:hypothetical protein [Emticicia oligotrophica]AFK05442.1 hypothetical protein Emtol_0170 [Emticicia oligotrophica DSM 17448]
MPRKKKDISEKEELFYKAFVSLIHKQIDDKIIENAEKCNPISPKQIAQFEKKRAEFLGVKYLIYRHLANGGGTLATLVQILDVCFQNNVPVSEIFTPEAFRKFKEKAELIAMNQETEQEDIYIPEFSD